MQLLDVLKSLWAGPAPTSPAGEVNAADRSSAYRTAGLVGLLSGLAFGLSYLASTGVVTSVGVATVLAYLASLARSTWTDYQAKLGDKAPKFFADMSSDDPELETAKGDSGPQCPSLELDSCGCCPHCCPCLNRCRMASFFPLPYLHWVPMLIVRGGYIELTYVLMPAVFTAIVVYRNRVAVEDEEQDEDDLEEGVEFAGVDKDGFVVHRKTQAPAGDVAAVQSGFAPPAEVVHASPGPGFEEPYPCPQQGSVLTSAMLREAAANAEPSVNKDGGGRYA